jgi:hypothetical protein
METQALDDLIMDVHVVEAQRARASAELDQITRTAKQALVHAGIDLELFFMVPGSGNAILAYGTPGDPDDDLWNRVRDVVVSVLQETTVWNDRNATASYAQPQGRLLIAQARLWTKSNWQAADEISGTSFQAQRSL